MALKALLLLGVIELASARMVVPNIALRTGQLTCDYTTTVTYKAKLLEARQASCPPPVTVTITQPPSAATIAVYYGPSVSSVLSYDSAIDQEIQQESSQDRPTGEYPDTTSHYYTHTVNGPAIWGTEASGDGTLYFAVNTLSVPVTTAVIGFPGAGSVLVDTFSVGGLPNTKSATTETPTSVATSSSEIPMQHTVTVYKSTITVTGTPHTTDAPVMTIDPGKNKHVKRQTCSMIFAELNGVWASWCNNWEGSVVTLPTSFQTTELLTSVVGASPVPQSVWSHSSSSSSSKNTSAIPTMTVTADTTTITTSPESSSAIASTPMTTDNTPPLSTKPIPTTNTSSISSPPPPAMSSACGQVGKFEVNFDNLPPFSTTTPDLETDGPPIFDPYDHFYWSQGYTYGPPPPLPYAPQSGTMLAWFNPKDAITPGNRQGRSQPGSFGAGDNHFEDSAFWFNANSVYIGCNSTSQRDQCTLQVTGYKLNVEDGTAVTGGMPSEIVVYSQQYSTPSICASPPCMLTQIFFDDRFSNLTTINFNATLNGQKVGFYMDSFAGTWSNNTCEAGNERQHSRK